MLSRIVIKQSAGAIAIDVRHAKLEGRPGRMEMSMEQNAAEVLTMANTLPKIRIDQSAAFASVGLKQSVPLANDIHAKALQNGLQAIGRIVQDGLEFLRIESQSQPIAAQAQRLGVQDLRLTVRALPSVGPDITLDEGSVDIDIPRPQLQVNWKWVDSTSEYTPYEVNITLARKPSIEISVEPGIELSFPTNMGVGGAVDEAI